MYVLDETGPAKQGNTLFYWFNYAASTPKHNTYIQQDQIRDETAKQYEKCVCVCVCVVMVRVRTSRGVLCSWCRPNRWWSKKSTHPSINTFYRFTLSSSPNPAHIPNNTHRYAADMIDCVCDKVRDERAKQYENCCKVAWLGWGRGISVCSWYYLICVQYIIFYWFTLSLIHPKHHHHRIGMCMCVSEVRDGKTKWKHCSVGWLHTYIYMSG